ncbi:hypothetical protein [Fluoribacter dumoffii]|uniref:hypothetical protein n=1 Tax=Fluoribacter dumoffii TaxID=463 RepID=UPI00026C8027|nr:hypothetical protein [Fluoribacter dumoffii]
MANIEERIGKVCKPRFRVKVRLKGFPTQQATFDRKTDARRRAQQTEAAIREGRHFKTTEAKRRTLGEIGFNVIDTHTSTIKEIVDFYR